MGRISKFVITLTPNGSYTGFSKFYFYKNGQQLPYTFIENININLEARIKIGETTLYLHTDNIYDAGSHSYHVEYIFGGNGSFYTKSGAYTTTITVTVEEGDLIFDYATFQMYVDAYPTYYAKSVNIDFYNENNKIADSYFSTYTKTPLPVNFPNLGTYYLIKDENNKYYYIDTNLKLKESFNKESDNFTFLPLLNYVKEDIKKLVSPKLISNEKFVLNYYNKDNENLFTNINLDSTKLNSIINIFSENNIKNLGFLIELNGKYYGVKYYKIIELSEQELLSKYIITNDTIEIFNIWYKNIPESEKINDIKLKLYFNLNQNEELKKLLINYNISMI